MPEIYAFRGWRYDLGHVGSLSDVIAPPYDVISPAFQDELYKKHPANIVRIDFNREEPGDDEKNNRYTRAAKFFRDWQAQGVLSREPQAAIYVYHQEFEYAGQTFNRRGFMARVRVEPFGVGKIFPHEETMSGPKVDRLNLTRACKANISQIFGLYPDPENAAQELLEKEIYGRPAIECVDHLGVKHRMWPVTNPELITAMAGIVGPQPVFIADGHHRYETSLNYRNELAAQGPLDANHPANFVLMMCIGMNDPGLLVLPTHRLFRGLPDLTAEQFIAKLGDAFTARIAGDGADLAPTVWNEVESGGEQGTMAFFTRADQRWVIASITSAGEQQMAELAADRSEPWRGLGVSILHRLLIGKLMGGQNLPTPKYVHLVEEAVDGIKTGEFPLTCLVMPATVEHVKEISSQAERMPAKSTYFYPKLLAGLVINSLEP